MPPSIFRTPNFSNQFPFPLQVRKIRIPLYHFVKGLSLAEEKEKTLYLEATLCLPIKVAGA